MTRTRAVARRTITRHYTLNERINNDCHPAPLSAHRKGDKAIGLGVLVHGEFERNDMVEYFGEQHDGFAFNKLG